MTRRRRSTSTPRSSASKRRHEIPLGERRVADGRVAGRAGGHRTAARAGRPPGGRPYKEALVEDGIPATSFAVDDVQEEFERLAALGVRFTQEPTRRWAAVTTAVFDDTCGNLIQIVQLRVGTVGIWALDSYASGVENVALAPSQGHQRPRRAARRRRRTTMRSSGWTTSASSSTTSRLRSRSSSNSVWSWRARRPSRDHGWTASSGSTASEATSR